ncbi:molybdenum cofactor biosynthesis protein MoaE [Hydrogenothermus marinus]|uniref:Molybdopterin synthase catalytic subunit n=1 Tax=Hydrogenothermus marinus TaxID=133270 RepID=A0A3M0BK58_9AQUI|nr:molybdenum cofactor biosynthesis protein MoaE [Hydrogenothermus marinus]RMA97591.1 molybdopterin synthase catalytic subunit [Hydrogenothermus marinus]
MVPEIYIGETWYSLEEIFSSYKDESCGAVDIFLGIPRSAPEDGEVLELHYEAYESMAEKVIKEIINEAKNKFGIKHAVVHHRTGVVPLLVPSFLVAVWAGHRQEAFAACRYIVDEVKARAPIWKKEIFKDKTESWK